MTHLLRILMTTMKIVLILNALFWLVIIAVHVHHMFTRNDRSVSVNVMVLLAGLLFAVSPYVLYFFCGQISQKPEKNP